MSNSLKWVKYVLEWRFLPVRFQKWLFGTGTRVVEFASFRVFACRYLRLAYLLQIQDDTRIYPDSSFRRHWRGSVVGDVLADLQRKRLFRLSIAGVGVHLVLDGSGVLGSVSACSHGYGYPADSVILVPFGWQ